MLRFAFFAGAYYLVVRWMYTACIEYLGWYYPDFMAGWYDIPHRAIRMIPEYGLRADTMVRGVVSDGDLLFWQLWIILALLVALVRFMATGHYRSRY